MGHTLDWPSKKQGPIIMSYYFSEPPREPYPVIKECNDSSSLEKDYGCDISTLSSVNLTCSASSFYPDLDLFFLQGTDKIATTETTEWTNDDGTRSKSVTINATPKETPYVCVASDVPGNQKERAITVFVSTASTWSTPTPPKYLNIVIIIGKYCQHTENNSNMFKCEPILRSSGMIIYHLVWFFRL